MTSRCSSRTLQRPRVCELVPRRRELRPRLFATVVRSKALLAFGAERQGVLWQRGAHHDGETSSFTFDSSSVAMSAPVDSIAQCSRKVRGKVS